MRLVSNFNHTFENAIRTAVQAIILRKYSIDIGYPIEMNKRETIAGIVLTAEINMKAYVEYNGIEVETFVVSLRKGRFSEKIFFKCTTCKHLLAMISNESNEFKFFDTILTVGTPTYHFRYCAFCYFIIMQWFSLKERCN